MTRYIKPPFQLDRPLFCKVPQQVRGRTIGVGEQYKWKELRLDQDKVQIMYVNGQLYHSDELEENLAPVIGDGLDELNIETLHKKVEEINGKVKQTGDSKIRMCKKSNIKDKQIGHIRSWRLYHGEIE